MAVHPRCDDDLVSEVLDEVIFQVRRHASVPVDVEIVDGEGTVWVHLAVVSLRDVRWTGTVPESVTARCLEFRRAGGGWLCRAAIDCGGNDV